MRLTNILIPTALLLAGVVPAQAEILRGEVLATESGAFYLAGTEWPVQFATEFPDNWFGRPLKMKVINNGTATNPVIKVTSVELTKEVFTLDEELHLGTYGHGAAYGSTGTFVSICLAHEHDLFWQALPGIGIWMLGPDPCGAITGFVDDDGVFDFWFKIPMISSLADERYHAQAMLFDVTCTPNVCLSNLVTRSVTD